MSAHSFSDYEKVIEENKGLRRELETANQAIEVLRERVAALIKAFDKWVDTPNFLNDEFDEFCGITESLRDYSEVVE